jgi:hypothetical protein
MYSDWCSDTNYSFVKARGKLKLDEAQIAYTNQQNKYVKRFKEGKCSAGDMNITRHRDVFYRNDFPCGNKCPHCGTFWID